MKKLIAVSALSLMGLASLPSFADTYQIDSEGAHASINFKIQHLGYSWLTGRFNDFEGQFSYDPDALAESDIEVTIDTGSIDSNHAERDRHLRSDDFLAVSEHPQATFVSTEVIPGEGDRFKVKGDLTLHGVTKNITINAKKVGEGEDPWGGYRVGFAGKTEIELKDFGIDYDLGPASQTVYLKLHIEGVKQ